MTAENQNESIRRLRTARRTTARTAQTTQDGSQDNNPDKAAAQTRTQARRHKQERTHARKHSGTYRQAGTQVCTQVGRYASRHAHTHACKNAHDQGQTARHPRMHASLQTYVISVRPASPNGPPPSPLPVGWCVVVWCGVVVGCFPPPCGVNDDDDDVDDDDVGDDDHHHHQLEHPDVSLAGRRVSSAHVPGNDYRFIDRSNCHRDRACQGTRS